MYCPRRHPIEADGAVCVLCAVDIGRYSGEQDRLEIVYCPPPGTLPCVGPARPAACADYLHLIAGGVCAEGWSVTTRLHGGMTLACHEVHGDNRSWALRQVHACMLYRACLLQLMCGTACTADNGTPSAQLEQLAHTPHPHARIVAHGCGMRWKHKWPEPLP